MAGTAIGLNPFPAEARYPEGRLEGNIFTANDGTEIDVTHLGKKNWNPKQERILSNLADEWQAAGYSDIGHIYEKLKSTVNQDYELGALLGSMNVALHMASSQNKWYHEYRNLFDEQKDFMIEQAGKFPTNPSILTETGAAFDTIDVLSHGPHIDYFKKAISLMRKLPEELRFQHGYKGIIDEDHDILEKSGYANPIRGPPYKPITWQHEINIRGPPYDTAKEFLEMALEDYPHDRGFQNDYKWVKRHL